MNGRTCQLCGKPLSRFSVGSGGDFCSRDHRNQFRLRLGMDRLQEANKVASLMRRRENAKAIPATQLAKDWKVQPRLAPVLRLPMRASALAVPGPLSPQMEVPRIAASDANLLLPRLEAALIRGHERSIEPRNSFLEHKQRPLLPSRPSRFAAHIAPAGVVLPRLEIPPGAGDRPRLADMAHAARRMHNNGIRLRPLESANYEGPACEARRLTNSADRGRELRVSGGIGFRLPAKRLRGLPASTPPVHPPVVKGEFEEMSGGCLPSQIEHKLAEIRLSIRELLGPRPPRQASVVEFRFPGAKGNGTRPRHAADGRKRACDLPWNATSPAAPQLRHTNGVHLRPSAPLVPYSAALRPHAIESNRRLTLVAFEPRETPFELPPTALDDTLLSGMHFGSAPVRHVETPAAVLEEHFDAGLQNWAGGLDDWKVDVAGVRPGSLALYSPSLEMRDYLLEFLTRIEIRGVTWLFRAANLENYYQATLAIVPEGGYQFRRLAVIGGNAETPIVHPVSTVPSGKTAVTLRTRVAGNEFTVSLDGRVIDTWTDSRLSAGGVGFVGSPEDRVRLYWVKVSPAGHQSKEHSKS